ncbi:MAG: hypothetical protein NC818_07430 [Candidatus Omnitrophica bacterium]|nr:hypothetical protein [Candidatus Omnitrophota bacterium]
MKIKTGILKLIFIFLGIETFFLNSPTPETSFLCERRIRGDFSVRQLTIPEYLKNYKSIKDYFLKKLENKKVPSEYLKIGEKFKILDWYKNYFWEKLLPHYSPSEIAYKLIEVFIRDIAFTITFQEITLNPPQKVLDLGSGSADYFRAFANLFKGFIAILGIEKESFWTKEAKDNISDFGLEDLGKYIDVLTKDMFALDEAKTVFDFKPYDLITLLHPNIFSPVIDILRKEPEDIAQTYYRIQLIKQLFQKIAQEFLAKNKEMIITIDKTYVPEIHSLKEVEKNLPSFLPNYLHYVGFVWALRLSGFSEEIVPATLVFPQANHLEKTDLKLKGNRENIIQFVFLLERLQEVAINFTVNIALDLFRLTYGERFVGVEILGRPDLKPFLWDALKEYEIKKDKGQLALRIITLLGKK